MIATPRTDANTFSTYDGFSTKAPVIRVVRREVCAEIEGELAVSNATIVALRGAGEITIERRVQLCEQLSAAMELK